MCFIEPLESRVAPAVLINPTTLNYVDKDGDLVTVKFSLPLLTSTTVANGIFTFNTGTVMTGTDTTEQQLELIQLAGSAAGTSITVTVKQAGHGDGYAAIGYIDAAGPLGAVSIDGDLGGISTGLSGVTAKTPAGLKSLNVLSMGAYGLATQPSSGFTATLGSTIDGPLGSLTVKTDIFDAGIGAASIGSIKIGGSLVGGSVQKSGSIGALGSIGAITIGGNVDGGTGESSGDITAGGTIASIKIGGSLIGGTGTGSPSSTEFTGYISSVGNMGPVSIGQNIVAGDFEESGKILSGGAMTSLTVGGSIVGGAGSQATSVNVAAQGEVAVATSLGSLKVGGDIDGGAGLQSGTVVANTTMGSVSVGGSVTGGAADMSGSIVGINQMGTVTVLGSLIGGGSSDPTGYADAGEIYSGGPMGAAKIGGSIVGGESGASGQIQADEMASIMVGGSVIGGSGPDSGEIYAYVKSGPMTVMHSVVGGSGDAAGTLISEGPSGLIKINGNLQGGTGVESGVVDIEEGTPSVQIGGSIVAGTVSASGGITSDASIGSVTVKGSVVGTTAEHAYIDAIGVIPAGTKSPKTDVAIKSINIGGDLTYGDILAGQDGDQLTKTAYQNGSAQLGAIKIGGNFIGSDIVAGAGPGTKGYGSGASVLPNTTAGIFSAIASITIGGQAIGTTGVDTSGTLYGIVAQDIGSVKIGAATIPLKAGPGNDTTAIPLGIDPGLNLYELAIVP